MWGVRGEKTRVSGLLELVELEGWREIAPNYSFIFIEIEKIVVFLRKL